MMTRIGAKLLSLVIALATMAVAHANMVVSPWIPIFKGIERAVGTNFPDATFPRLQVANCVRIDLTDPDIKFLPTPRAPNFNGSSIETTAMSVSNYMTIHGAQVVANCNFHSAPDTGPEGANGSVKGLLISTNQIVSPVGDSRYSTLLFTSNKEPIFLFNNVPPGTNTTGVYAAVSGYYPVVSNGVNVGDASINAYPGGPHDPNPRTGYGISQDKRYLYLMVLDGRQSGYSEGAIDAETGAWLLLFGAWDGMNMDGGGSTAMYMADCSGNPAPLGHSSFVKGYGRERVIGAHFGVYALPLSAFVFNVAATPGSTGATITWDTQTNATSRVEYGTTPNYGTLSPLDSTLLTNHTVTLGGLVPGTKYYFRVLSQVGSNQYSSSCGISSFATTNVGVSLMFNLTNDWKFSTNNLDAVNWKPAAYDDGGWTNHGRGALWADSRVQIPATSTNNIPYFTNGTRMPINNATTYPFVTYYLRTRFVFSGNPSGASMTFSNYIDDGAVFYLNGGEIFRTNMPAAPQVVTNGTLASATQCSGNNAVCPMMFTLSGSSLSNLITGTNVLAVEVHNSAVNSPDITFESAVFATVPPPAQIISNVVASAGETNVTISWTTTPNGTAQVQYGPTPALGSSNTLDTTLSASHSVTLNGLQANTPYYFRVLSSAAGNSFFVDGTFTTISLYVPVLTSANIWKFTTNNLDGTNWTAQSYDDSDWTGQGPALLYIEDNASISPRTTLLPARTNGQVHSTYYFRTHFAVTNNLAGLSLLFTPFIDDGAVFYLNGAEIQRVRMTPAPQAISYATLALDCPPNDCDTGLDAPDVFRISGSAMTNVVVGGDNVLAAEVHQFTTNDTDIVFGSTVGLVRALVTETKMRVSRTNNVVCFSWDGDGFILQRADVLTGASPWSDVPGPIKSSPYCTTNPAVTTYYRLRN